MILFFVFLLLIFLSKSETYFVDQINGSDESDGTTEASAFQSLSKINTLFSSGYVSGGDRILLKRGSVFSGQSISIDHREFEGEPVEFGSYGDEYAEKPIIHPAVEIPNDWTPAPAIGDGVYKIPFDVSLGFEPTELVIVAVDGQLETKTVARVNEKWMADGSGHVWLAYPPDGEYTYDSDPPIQFWDGIEAFWGTMADGFLYIRFRDENHPSEFNLHASCVNGIDVRNVKNVIFRDLVVRAAPKAVYLYLSDTITIDNCYLLNGGTRVYTEFSGNVTITNNDIFLSYYGYDDMGADKPGDPYGTQIRGHVYVTFKYRIGDRSSADTGVKMVFKASNSIVRGNHIHDGMLAFSFFSDAERGPMDNIEISDNLIQNFTSLALSFSTFLTNMRIVRNRFYNSAGSLSVRYLNTEGDVRSGVISHNIFWIPGVVSGHHAFHFVVSDPPNTNCSPDIVFTRNIYFGGRNAMNIPTTLTLTIGKLDKMKFTHNIYSSDEMVYGGYDVIHAEKDIIDLFDYNLCGGKFHHGQPTYWYGENNVGQEGSYFWSPFSTEPNFRLEFRAPLTHY